MLNLPDLEQMIEDEKYLNWTYYFNLFLYEVYKKIKKKNNDKKK